jgi:hypothetical protein
MSGNELFAYDLAADGDTLPGRSLGKLLSEAVATDCRALCVGPDGRVWAGVNGTFAGRGDWLHLVSYRPGDATGGSARPAGRLAPADSAPSRPQESGPAIRDHGPIAIRNADYTAFTDEAGQPLPWHNGVHRPLADGPLVPRYAIMGICAADTGRVYMTTLAPFTLHEFGPEQLR